MTTLALERRQPFTLLLITLIALAWLALALWEASPYGRYLDHGQWTDVGLAASICRVLPGGPSVLPALIYAGGWLLMIAAMMLPTTLPLIGIFARLTESRPDRSMLLTLVIAGYMLAWVVFGLVAHLLDLLLHGLISSTGWLAFNGWIVGAGVLAVAGLFQFSALKYRCLEKCRAPFGFVNEHWQGRSVRQDALWLGIHHGLFCVGCCWAIMLLMFVVGTGSVGWMLALAALMAIEKNTLWGRRLSAPLGIFLLLCAAIVVVEHFGRGQLG